jgi:hypothetical protein
VRHYQGAKAPLIERLHHGAGMETIQLQGPTVQLSKSCAVFLVAEAHSQVPCSPALPAVRASHRQVHCLAPDVRWLVEMLLCTAGFTCPKLLAARLETVLEVRPMQFRPALNSDCLYVWILCVVH